MSEVCWIRVRARFRVRVSELRLRHLRERGEETLEHLARGGEGLGVRG